MWLRWGFLDFTKLMLNSTQVEYFVEFGVVENTCENPLFAANKISKFGPDLSMLIAALWLNHDFVI